MKNIILIFLVFPFINCFGQEYSKKWSNINYANDEMEYHLMDIYLPKSTKQSYPVVVLIYGSAWSSNNLKGSDMNTLGNALLNAGYAVVTPNHRSSSDALFPAQLHDIKATIRFIRANCYAFQLDTSFIGITGSSSGGHLASLAGTTNNIKQFTIDTLSLDIEGSVGNFNNYNSDVDAVCDWFGPTNFLKMDSCGSFLVHNAPDSPESRLIGGPIQDNQIKCAFANPITYVDQTDPPFLIIHGDADQLVPYCNSEELYNALQLAEVESDYILVSGGQHYTGVHTTTYISKMIDFFNDLSINEINSSTKIKNETALLIFPNPMSDIITFRHPSNTFFRNYEIFDSSGKIISKENTISNQMNLSYLDKGLYYIRIFAKNGKTYMTKIIKQ